jgi:hypothetical protein
MGRRRLRLTGLAFLLAAAMLGAEEASPGDSEEEMFGTGDVVEEKREPGDVTADAAPEAPPEEAFLVSETLEWGGRIDNTLDASWVWTAYPGTWEALRSGAQPAVSAQLQADLFFDARPSRAFRVFGKAKFAYASTGPGEDWLWEAQIFELFSDFNYRERVFFRTGKQVVQWGVGYFFSPADVLSLVSIDPEEPENEREGPLAIKAQAPLGVHNLYLYLVSDGIDRLEEIAVAPKLELVLGGYEMGIGGFYQKDLSPKAMLTLTGPLWKLDVFGEALLQWGSDRTFVSLDPPPDDTYQIEDRLLFSGTGGFSYLNPDWNLALFAQYFYNGQGYKNYDAAMAAAAAAALIAGQITAADLLYRNRHYLAASVSLSDLFDAGLGASVLLLASLSDGSGQVMPTFSWEPFDHLRLYASLALGFGGAGSEYAPAGPGMTLELGLSAGAGRF